MNPLGHHSDICLLLNIFREIGSRKALRVGDYEQINEAIPPLRERLGLDGTGHHIFTDAELFGKGGWYGDRRVTLTREIGSGAEGHVYSGEIGDSPVAVKIPFQYADLDAIVMKNFLNEFFIHLELFCGLRQFHNHKAARIPKIEFVCKYSNPAGPTYMVGMQPLDGTLDTWMTYVMDWTPEQNSLQFIAMLEAVCLLLKHLQDEYGFHHRDLHANNIMFHEERDAQGDAVYKWFVIDLGASTILLDGRRHNLNIEGADDMKPNYGHDIWWLLAVMTSAVIGRLTPNLQIYLNEIRDSQVQGAGVSDRYPLTDPRAMLKRLGKIKKDIATARRSSSRSRGPRYTIS